MCISISTLRSTLQGAARSRYRLTSTTKIGECSSAVLAVGFHVSNIILLCVSGRTFAGVRSSHLHETHIV